MCVAIICFIYITFNCSIGLQSFNAIHLFMASSAILETRKLVFKLSLDF